MLPYPDDDTTLGRHSLPHDDRRLYLVYEEYMCVQDDENGEKYDWRTWVDEIYRWRGDGYDESILIHISEMEKWQEPTKHKFRNHRLVVANVTVDWQVVDPTVN